MAAIGHFIPTWILVGGLVIGHVVSSPPPSAGVSPKLTAVRGTPAAEMLLVATLAAEMLTVVQDTPAASMLVVVLGYPAVAMLAAALLTAAQGTTVVAAVLGTPLLEGQLSTKCPHSPQMRHQHELSLFGSWAGHTSLARHRDRQLVPFFCLWADEIVNVIKSRAVVMLYAAEVSVSLITAVARWGVLSLCGTFTLSSRIKISTQKPHSSDETGQCLYSATKAVLVAMVMTFFEMFNIPVFWPILVLYFIMLTCMTMKRQIRHMIKYRYVPFSHGKTRYRGKEDTGDVFIS
ncbi:UNVERIFIED_CONTAM: hypothetical protein FKN15_066208 [Acipenser sinensis]